MVSHNVVSHNVVSHIVWYRNCALTHKCTFMGAPNNPRQHHPTNSKTPPTCSPGVGHHFNPLAVSSTPLKPILPPPHSLSLTRRAKAQNGITSNLQPYHWVLIWQDKRRGIVAVGIKTVLWSCVFCLNICSVTPPV